MNIARLVLAALAGTVTYFALGFIVFGAMPMVRNEYAKYPAVYRSRESMKAVAPIGMLAMFAAIVVLTILFAMPHRESPTFAGGAAFGALIGVFAVCSFVLHNYVNLNIGLKLTLEQAAAYLIEWTVVGAVIGAVYKPG